MDDRVDKESIIKYLGKEADISSLLYFDSIPSTNTFLKENASGFPGWTVAVAGNQTSGRGRSGRSFFSPDGTGIYLSILLKEDLRFEDASLLTTAAAVAACDAIYGCTGAVPSIKWVNDIIVKERKVSGILSETRAEAGKERPDWIVTGIGFNVYPPDGGFPEDIRDKAGSITDRTSPFLRSRLAAGFITRFRLLTRDLNDPDIYEEYKKRLFILGKKIYVISGNESCLAEALDLLPDFSLKVRYEDGREEALKCGEVSTRLEKEK